MKIQFVCGHYYPDNFLISEIAEELVKKGNEVSILTGLPSYNTGYIPKDYRFFKKRKETINGVIIKRVATTSRGKTKLSRIVSYLSFFINSSIYAMTHKFDCDIVFAYQLAPILMVNSGIIIKNKTKKPLFIYCLDPWPDQLRAWNINENSIIYKILHVYSKFAYNNANMIGVSSKSFLDYLNKINKVDKNKMIYLPQYSNEIKIKNTPIKKTKCVDIVYAGSIGRQQNLELLLKAIAKIQTNKNYHFHICGDGIEYLKCKKISSNLKINEHITFYGRVDRGKLIEIYTLADAFVLTLKSEKEIGYSANTVPLRFINYLSVGKPIIASIDGETKEIIEKENCGLVSNADNLYDLSLNLSKFINDKDSYDRCGKNAKKYFDNNFQKSIILNKINEVLSSIKKQV